MTFSAKSTETPQTTYMVTTESFAAHDRDPEKSKQKVNIFHSEVNM